MSTSMVVLAEANIGISFCLTLLFLLHSQLLALWSAVSLIHLVLKIFLKMNLISNRMIEKQLLTRVWQIGGSVLRMTVLWLFIPHCV